MVATIVAVWIDKAIFVVITVPEGDAIVPVV
jgi:hypothetical protein